MLKNTLAGRVTVALAVAGSVALGAPALTAAPAQATTATTVVARPGSTGTVVRTLQTNLATLGYFKASATGTYGPVTTAAVKAYQSKHHLTANGVVTSALANRIGADATAARTKAMSRVIDKRCLTGARVMCANKTTHKLYYVVNGKVVLSLDARFGRASLPTREGTFHVYKMGKNWVSSLYHVSMPYAMFFSGGEAVHYSADFAANGQGVGSHGCINLRDKASIAWIYSHTRIGDKVVVYRS